MYIELQKKILEETKLRTSLENELTIQQTMKNELEIALKLMDHSLTDKQDIINRLRDQLDQVKSLNLELNQKSISLSQESSQDKEKLGKVSKENEELKINLNETKTMLLERVEAFKRQSEELVNYRIKCEQLESNLTIEKNWRLELQNELTKKNDLIRGLNEKLAHLNEMKIEFEQLKIENSNLKEVRQELEKTLEEMGSKLGTSHLKIDDFKEVSKHVNEFQWEQDDAVTVCKLCVKDFSVARRKHRKYDKLLKLKFFFSFNIHITYKIDCRRCGGIYCNECSVNNF
jgi:DNA repair exonuclease SbcCD ATPase subunit